VPPFNRKYRRSISILKVSDLKHEKIGKIIKEYDHEKRKSTQQTGAKDSKIFQKPTNTMENYIMNSPKEDVVPQTSPGPQRIQESENNLTNLKKKMIGPTNIASVNNDGEQPEDALSFSESDNVSLGHTEISSEKVGSGSEAEESISKHSSSSDATLMFSTEQLNMHREAEMVNIEKPIDRVKSFPVEKEVQDKMGKRKNQESNLKQKMDTAFTVPDPTMESDRLTLTNTNSQHNALTTAATDSYGRSHAFRILSHHSNCGVSGTYDLIWETFLLLT